MKTRFLSLLALLTSTTCLWGQVEAPRWVVVAPPEFRKALEPLCQQRKVDGFQVEVVLTSDHLTDKQIRAGDGSPLRDHLHQLCRKTDGPNFILLVGAHQAMDSPSPEKSVVPPLRGAIGRMKGQATDLGYALLDKEGVPIVAVGRFPARSESEVRQMVQKTLDFERNPPPGLWRNQITLLVGNPGGSSVLEKRFAGMFVQNLAGSRFVRLHPMWKVRTLIHASSSPFCVPDDRLREVSLRYLQEGQVFSAYLGHSGADGFWSGGPPFVSRVDWSKEKIKGVFFTCGCFGCQVQGSDGEGYGLTAMRNPAGPVAVIGATGESFGAMGQLALDGLLDCLSRPDPPVRLSDYWLAVQAGLARGKMDVFSFWLFDQADGSKGKVPMDVQQKEHLEMWVLLGDPALRLPFLPRDILLKTADEAKPGKTLTLEGTVPDRLAGVRIRMTLERPSGSVPLGLKPLSQDPVQARNVMLANHEKANEVVLALEEIQAREKTFQWQVKVPFEVPWPRLIVRAHAVAPPGEALGLLTLPIKK